MYKISEIISIPIISIYECDFQGIVYNVMFDTKLKKCKFLCVLNENEGVNKSLNISDIYQIGKDCIFIKNNSIIDLKCNNDNEFSIYTSLLNLPVYNFNGKSLGTCTDITIDKKFSIKSLHLNSGQIINIENIVNLGKTAILVSLNNVNINKFKPKQKLQTNLKPREDKVIILSELNSSNYPSPQKEEIKNNNNNKIITDFKFLIGRLIEKDIIAFNGELIAKKNTTISKEIVNKASMYGKLAEITRFSKKMLL